MKTKYQLVNPNNARIYIDYKDKDNPVRFQYVGNKHPLRVIMETMFILYYSRYFFILLIPSLIGLSYLINNMTSSYLLRIVWNWIILIDVFFIFPILISLLFYYDKRFMKLMPHIWYNLLGGPLYKINISPHDIVKNKYEIPLFKNIGLNYSATKDFSKYLSRIEIIEHPFRACIGRKEIPQEYLWRATFYFSRKPKEGQLRLQFK